MMTDKLREMGNLFFLLTSTRPEDGIKLWCAWAAPHPHGQIEFFETPLIQPVTELDNTRAELDALNFQHSQQDIGFGYTLHLYRAPDVQQSELLIMARFDRWLAVLLSSAMDAKARQS